MPLFGRRRSSERDQTTTPTTTSTTTTTTTTTPPVGNHATGLLISTPTLPTSAVFGRRMTGGRWFGASTEQSRIAKWLDRWHSQIATQAASVRLAFLERLRVLTVAYKNAKEAKDTTTDRTSHITGLTTLIAEIDAVVQRATQEEQQASALPGLADLDARVFGALDAFNTGDLSPLGSGMLNETFTAAFDAHGTEGVLKYEKAVDTAYGLHRGTAAGLPRQNPNQTGRAVATYVMAQLLGLDRYVPKTYYASYGGEAAQLMEKLEGRTGEMNPATMMSAYRSEIHDADAGVIYWLDIVCGQVDRHKGNFMLHTDASGMTGRVSAIDNDLSFGSNYGVDPKEGTSRNTARDSSLAIAGKEARRLPISRQLATRIIQVSRAPLLVRAALDGLLTAAEVDATVDRLTNLASYLVRRLSKDDRIT